MSLNLIRKITLFVKKDNKKKSNFQEFFNKDSFCFVT